MDSHLRSIVKALSWRALGSFWTAGLAWLVTGRVGAAVVIGAGDALVKVIVFYAHERLWDRIAFGRAKPPEYQI